MNNFITLQWFKTQFFPYLNEWEQSVKDRKGFRRRKKIMTLTSETSEGIRIAGNSLYIHDYNYSKTQLMCMSIIQLSCNNNSYNYSFI